MWTNSWCGRPRSPSAATARLSDREIAVAIGVAQGQTNRAIGRQLLIAESTVRDYVSTALKKHVPEQPGSPGGLGDAERPRHRAPDICRIRSRHLQD